MNSEERPPVSRFCIRIQQDLLERVKQQAIRNRRSTGKEIESIIANYFEEKDKQKS